MPLTPALFKRSTYIFISTYNLYIFIYKIKISLFIYKDIYLSLFIYKDKYISLSIYTYIEYICILYNYFCVCACIRMYIYAYICSVVSDSLPFPSLQPAKLLCPLDFSGKNIGVGCRFLLQDIFPTQGSNPSLLCLLHWQADSLPLNHLGSPVYM